MSYCRYHPLSAAAQSCEACNSLLCDACTDQNFEQSKTLCLLCGGVTQSVGARSDIVPFWRRLDKAFRYPMHTPVLIFILVTSLLGSIALLLPVLFMIPLYLVCAGITIKFCFNCLAETAVGNMNPPDISESYQGGLKIMLRIFVAVVLISVVVGVVYQSVNESLAILFGVFLVISLPAIIIEYAMTESLTSALNPITILTMIARIGIPYALILAILMIMSGSMEVLSSFVPAEVSFVSVGLGSVISSYYTVVMFHLMGYMIFQYQHELGYSADMIQENEAGVRTEADKILARIMLLIKEGYWGGARKQFKREVKLFPNSDKLNSAYFQFVIASTDKSGENEAEIFDGYLNYLLRAGQKDKLIMSHAKARIAMPVYVPGMPELRHSLAQSYSHKGDSKAAVKLLNGLHKAHPDYWDLIPAYQLLALTLADLPNMSKHAQQCLKLIEALKLRKAQQSKGTPAVAKAKFEQPLEDEPSKPEAPQEKSRPGELALVEFE